MTWAEWLALAFGTVMVLVWLSMLVSVKTEHAWMPRELWRGRLIYSEKPFSIQRPVRLNVRIDRAYLVGDYIQLVELKVREAQRLFPSDVIEMSAQRLAVEKSTGTNVSDFGIVVLQRPDSGRRTVKKVWLLDKEAVVELARRREDIRSGKVQPKRANSIDICCACPYQRECNRWKMEGLHADV